MTAGIRVLGPLEAEVEGARADLGGPLQRAVLALLLMERGRVVSVDRMIDQLWRGEPPPRAIASLQAYVSNLRRILEPGRARRAQARILVSAPPGYAVRLPDEAVDAWRFESLLTAARKDAPGQPERARQELEQALALWRGPAYAEFADEEWATAEVVRLTEQHLAAQEAWAEVALRTGAAAEAVPAAEALIRQQPLREGSWRLLALSLWACDRQADALAALRRARRMLRDELGLEPGPALAEVEEAILGQRQEVLRRVQPLPAPAGRQARRSQAAAPEAGGREPDTGRPVRRARRRAQGYRRCGGPARRGRGADHRRRRRWQNEAPGSGGRTPGGGGLEGGDGQLPGRGRSPVRLGVDRSASRRWRRVYHPRNQPGPSARCSIPTHGPPAQAQARCRGGRRGDALQAPSGGGRLAAAGCGREARGRAPR